MADPIVATYISANSFSVVGDLTTLFDVGRRAKLLGNSIWYGTIISTVYTTLTTVTISTSNLDASLTGALVSQVSGTEALAAQTIHDHDGDEGSGGQLNHTTLTNIGINTHPEIDAALITSTDHIADTTSNPHVVLATQITDFDTEVSNNTDVVHNTAKISYDATASTKVDFITITQPVDLDQMEIDVINNNAKISYDSTSSAKLDFISITQPVDLDIVEADTNINNAKISYDATSSAKVDFITITQPVDLDQIEIDVTANNAKVTNATHTGEVTGDEALTIADNVVDEANLMLDDTPTNDYVLTADSTASGGLKWAPPQGGDTSPLTTKGDVYSYDTDDARLGVGADGQVLTADSTSVIGLKWETNPVGVTDHTLLSNIGINTHPQIDTAITNSGDHIADTTSNPHVVLATQISDFDTEVSNNTDVVNNTAKISYDSTSSAKLDFITVTQPVDLDQMEIDVTANNAKVTNATHTGEVTGDEALTITDNVVDEANLMLDTGPTNDFVLTADSTASGGMKWASGSSASSPLTTKGDVYTYDTDDARLGVGIDGQVLTVDSTSSLGLKWETNPVGVTDHTLLSNIGINTHPEIDTAITNSEDHIADTTSNPHVVLATQITDFDTEVSNNVDVVNNTAKISYDSTSSAKLDFITVTQPVDLDQMEIDVTANNAKVTNATHTGEVTGSGALTVADNIIDEANLKLDSGPTNDFVLTADDGESGGMKWAAGGSASSPLTTKGDLYGYDTDDARIGVGIDGQVLTVDSTSALGLKWATSPAGVTDHTLLSNIGTNTHPEIDTHIADTTSNPHDVDATDVGLGSIQGEVDLNTAHRISDGTSHAHVVLNDAHRETITGNPHQVDLEDARSQDNELAGDVDYNNNDIVDIKGIGFQSGQEVTWNGTDYTINIPTGLGPILQTGQEMYVIVYNDTGAQIDNLSAVHPVAGATAGRPHIEKAIAHEFTGIDRAIWITTMDIPIDSIGIVTNFGNVRGVDTGSWSAGDNLWVSSTTAGELVNTKPDFPDYDIQVGGVAVSDSTAGVVFVSIQGDIDDTFDNFHNGTFRESFDFTITADSTADVITGFLEPSNSNENMTMMFSDGFTMLDTDPPKEIVLTAGTDVIPQTNYVYILETTKVLTVSTSDWPTTEHIKVAQCLLQTAATTETNGALRNQNWNDHIEGADNQGHLSHVTERIRQINAQWNSGTEATLSGTGSNNVYITCTSGIVYQMHRQTFPAINMVTGGDIHVVNDPTTAYRTTSNLNDITEYSDGSTWSTGNWSSLVVWGVCNKTGETSHLMCNLPSDGYNLEASATTDVSGYADYNIPNEFKGVGFLIGRFIIQKNSGSGWTYNDNSVDLRGFIPNNTAGGGGGGGGVTTFTGLTDTPSSYSSEANKVVSVASGETALEFTVNETNATHTGEVTGSGALTIAENVVDVTNLLVGVGEVNDYVLTADSGETGGMKWAAQDVGMTDPMTTLGDIIIRTVGDVTTRLPIGTEDQVLTVGATSDVTWEEPNISAADVDDLTDGNGTSLHYHSADRDRSNHTGTQTASTISDFDTEVANNSAVAANTSKVTNATHTGEVTGSGALTVADNIIDEANLKLDSGPTNDYVLTADSGESGGMKWALASGSSPLTTKGDVYVYDTDDARLPVGTDAQVLTVDSTSSIGLAWKNNPAGFADPMTTRGDLIYKDPAGDTVRLPAYDGSSPTGEYYLKSNDVDIFWDDISDIIRTGATINNPAGSFAQFSGASGLLIAGRTATQTKEDLSLDNVPNTDFTTPVSLNTAKETNATHTGEVTGDEALTIADNIIDEANLKLDTGPTDNYVLTADSTASGGLKWAAAGSGGGNVSTSGTPVDNDFAKFVNGTDIEGRSYAETKADLAIVAADISDFDTEVTNNTEVTANTAKVTNATHSGEVTGSGALTITDNIIDEANLKLDSGPTNDYVLTADSGESGGMKWAPAGGGDTSPLTTKGDLYTYDSDNQRLAVGTNNFVLTADSSEATGMKWAASQGTDPISGATGDSIVRADGSNALQDSGIIINDTDDMTLPATSSLTCPEKLVIPLDEPGSLTNGCIWIS